MGAPAPATPPPAPPMWTPMPAAAPRGMAVPYRLLALLGQGIGFLLLVVGTLVAVVGATVWGGCFTSACGSSVYAGIANSIGTSKILWTLGLLFLGGGLALKLHYLLPMPTSGRAEEVAFVASERRGAHWLLLIVVVLLAVLLLSINQWPPIGGTGAGLP